DVRRLREAVPLRYPRDGCSHRHSGWWKKDSSARFLRAACWATPEWQAGSLPHKPGRQDACPHRHSGRRRSILLVPGELVMSHLRWHGRSGFTLIEFLVVSAILVVLFAILVPAIQKVREASNRASCASNQRQILQAMHGFHSSKKNFPPNGDTTFYW